MKRGTCTLVLAAAMMGLTSTASAAGDPWSCRASAARVTLPGDTGPPTTEPIRANAPLDPCTSQSTSVLEPKTIGPLTINLAGAFTARGADNSGAGALTSISNPKVVLGPLKVEADAVQAVAQGGCNGTTPALSSASKVVNLRINDTSIELPPGDAPFRQELGPLGFVAANQEVVEGTVMTRRAVWISTPAGEVVLAEAIAGHGPTACKPTPGDTGGGGNGGGVAGTVNTGGGGPNPCPDGATYEPHRNLCVIRASDGGSDRQGAHGEIVVGRPYQGPSGGTAVALAEARTRFKSPCLKGLGPAYVIVGTKGNDKVTGTNGRDRILLLAGRDNSEGGRGDDCMDGGSGTDTLSGALGKDRLFGRGGADHLVGGSHSDRLRAGSGKDTINTGYGRDRVFAGKGADRINAAVAGPGARRIDCGKGRDKVRFNRNERRVVKRCEQRYIVH